MSGNVTSGLRSRLVFDEERGEYRDGAARYLMMRADVLMGLFAALPEAGRLPALQALGRSAEAFGGGSGLAYRTAGARDPATLMHTMAATAAGLGWGRWRFTADGSAILVEVANSPFAAGAGRSAHPVCHAVCGILGAMGTAVLGGPAEATETSCAACGDAAACCFRIATTEASAP